MSTVAGAGSGRRAHPAVNATGLSVVFCPVTVGTPILAMPHPARPPAAGQKPVSAPPPGRFTLQIRLLRLPSRQSIGSTHLPRRCSWDPDSADGRSGGIKAVKFGNGEQVGSLRARTDAPIGCSSPPSPPCGSCPSVRRPSAHASPPVQALTAAGQRQVDVQRSEWLAELDREPAARHQDGAARASDRAGPARAAAALPRRHVSAALRLVTRPYGSLSSRHCYTSVLLAVTRNAFDMGDGRCQDKHRWRPASLDGPDPVRQLRIVPARAPHASIVGLRPVGFRRRSRWSKVR